MKRFAAALLLLAMLLSLTGCGIDYDYWDYDTIYGWYEVTKATGIYESLVGTRQDCIARLQSEGFRGIGEGTAAFYDENHYEEPFFTLSGDFGDRRLKAESGTLDGKPLTKMKVTWKSDRAIKVRGAMWLEGTIGNEDGTITLQSCIAAGNGWYRIQEGETGKLKLSWEQLKPEYFTQSLVFARQGGEYACQYFPTLHTPLPEDTVKICWGTEFPAEQQNQLLWLEQDPDFSQIVLDSDADVLFFEIFTLTETGEREYLYSKEWNYTEFPVTVQLPKLDGSQTFGISYQDYHEREYIYFIRIDEDGALYLAPGQ